MTGVLEEAGELLLASGEREEASEAEVTLGNVYWFRAERDRALPRFEQAAVLIEQLAPSRSKASVLSELARFAMLADEDAKAVDLARGALAMAEEFGYEEVRARALNILGVSGVKLGDRGALTNLERCLETAESGSPEKIRGFINLASVLGELGELRRSIELHEEGLREVERMGAPGQMRWLRAERVWDEYLTGRWNEAVAHADEFIAEVDAGQPHYMEPVVREARGLIRLARGDGRGRSPTPSGRSRSRGPPRILRLSIRSWPIRATSCSRRAAGRKLFPSWTSCSRFLRSSRSSFVSFWSTALAAVLTTLVRSSDLEAVVENAAISTRWLDGARAYAAGAFEEAADVYAEIGAAPDEAFARLRAAESLEDAGRRVDADAHLRRALAFYRSVGATAYIREGERLFAASA